jgi:hypothetical protein
MYSQYLEYSENIFIEIKTALFGEISKEEMRRRACDLTAAEAHIRRGGCGEYRCADAE